MNSGAGDAIPGLFNTGDSQENPNSMAGPLWAKMRPRTREDWVAWDPSLAELSQRFCDHPFSLILYGPPGTGKTTLAEILLKETNWRTLSFPAASVSLDKIRKEIDRSPRRTVLFLDEIHRFSKARQDFFLKPLEEGRIVLLAATTESPWYYLTRPLLSRVLVKEVTIPDKKIFTGIIQKFWKKYNDNSLPDSVSAAVGEYCWPDFRRAWQLIDFLQPFSGSGEKLTEKAGQWARDNPGSGEPTGIGEYDYLSALIKSIRGSDPDAALVYLARLLSPHLGVDPTLVARRLVVLASEDVGLANPQALPLATQTLIAVEKIGMPEARIHLAHATVYLAVSPKSNRTYIAYEKAARLVAGQHFAPPDHLRNQGPGRKNYLYPHDYPGNFVKQNYWPPDLPKETLLDWGGSRSQAEERMVEHLKRLKGDGEG